MVSVISFKDNDFSLFYEHWAHKTVRNKFHVGIRAIDDPCLSLWFLQRSIIYKTVESCTCNLYFKNILSLLYVFTDFSNIRRTPEGSDMLSVDFHLSYG